MKKILPTHRIKLTTYYLLLTASLLLHADPITYLDATGTLHTTNATPVTATTTNKFFTAKSGE